MIITKLTGGLANQMFQYAYGCRSVIENNTELKLDISAFDQMDTTDTPRQYALQVFKIQASVASDKEINKLKRGLLNRIKNRFKLKHRKSLVKDYHHFDENYLSVSGNAFLTGDWQCEKYFADAGDIIRQEFTLKDQWSEAAERMSQEIKKGDAISVHIRRGDYVNNPKYTAYYKILTPEYYNRAAQEVSKNIEQPCFYIFSDNIEWAKENLKLPGEMKFASNPDLKDYEEMILMSYCKHHIIANSSFSWWPAWLNPSPNKMVIAPQKWFKDLGRDTSDLIPDSWTRL